MASEEREVYVPYYIGDVAEAKANWGWLLAVGVILTLAGLAAISTSVWTTFVTIIAIGVLALVSGILQLISSFWAHRWSGFFISLFAGICYTVLGVFIIGHPAASAIGVTLLLAAFYIVAGIFRIGVALTRRFQNWGLVLFNGVIALLLGILIWADWPVSGLWVIGLFVGIDLFFIGITWIILAISARKHQPTA